MDAHGLVLAADEGNEMGGGSGAADFCCTRRCDRAGLSGILGDGAESGVWLIVAFREDRAVIIEQKFPAEFFFLHTLKIGDFISTFLVRKGTVVRDIVMVAHDAYHAVRRLQLTEDRNERLEFAFIKRDEITSKDDGIRLEGVYLIYDTEKFVLMTYPTIEVEIRNLNDAEAVIRLRKPLTSDSDRLNLMEISAEEIAPTEENEP